MAGLYREHSVIDASIYRWKAKFGEMDVSEAKRLKRLLTDAILDNAAWGSAKLSPISWRLWDERMAGVQSHQPLPYDRKIQGAVRSAANPSARLATS